MKNLLFILLFFVLQISIPVYSQNSEIKNPCDCLEIVIKNNELIKCSDYFIKELDYLENLSVIVALGKVAFDNCLKIYKKKFKIDKKFEFKHGKKYLLPDNKTLIASYHPSPRNVNTKVVTIRMINQLFRKAKKIAKF